LPNPQQAKVQHRNSHDRNAAENLKQAKRQKQPPTPRNAHRTLELRKNLARL
jgi:hypothetical protein